LVVVFALTTTIIDELDWLLKVIPVDTYVFDRYFTPRLAIMLQYVGFGCVNYFNSFK